MNLEWSEVTEWLDQARRLNAEAAEDGGTDGA